MPAITSLLIALRFRCAGSMVIMRSGDKGNISNIGVIARRPEWLPLLGDRLTPEVVEAYFKHLPAGRVTRFYLRGTSSMNLLIHDALDGGGASSMRMDPLGKGMAQMLLDMKVEVPRSVAALVQGVSRQGTASGFCSATAAPTESPSTRSATAWTATV